MSADNAPLLELREVCVNFMRARSLADLFARRVPPAVAAVRSASLVVAPGETVGLVGESGSGKTTLGRAILQVAPVASGEILFRGRGIQERDADWQRSLRRGIQMVFQDPYSSLNPRMTVAQTLAEVLRFHHVETSAALPDEVARLMRLVGLPPSLAARLPRGMSGGQRQRVGLARALAVRPDLLVLDEPVAALDVSIQAQILNLLADLRQELGVAMLFVAHDLSVVRHISDRVAVMYRGTIVEQGTRDEIFRKPAHPYTRALLAAVPRVGGGRRHRQVQPATDLAQPSGGCAFAPRCPSADERCWRRAPAPVALSPTQVVTCHLVTPPGHTDQDALRG